MKLNPIRKRRCGLKDLIRSFFQKEKIEYYATLPYGSLKVTRPYLTERAGISPACAVVFLIPYYSVEGVNISSYAVARDYHSYVRSVTERLSRVLSEAYPEYTYIGFGDHSPIDERHAALAAGLGILGKNRLLINEKYGSYVFIAELVTDAPPELLGAAEPKPSRTCSECGACLERCPTGHITGCAPCLSDITQRKGELTEAEIALMRRVGTAWGCDECQRACPHNASPVATPIDFFRGQLIPSLTSPVIDSMGEEEFKARAYSWRGKGTVARNLEILKK